MACRTYLRETQALRQSAWWWPPRQHEAAGREAVGELGVRELAGQVGAGQRLAALAAARPARRRVLVVGDGQRGHGRASSCGVLAVSGRHFLSTEPTESTETASVGSVRSVDRMPERRPEPTFFASPDEFGGWLAEHGDQEAEVLVGYWKVGTGKPSMTWA